MRIEQKLPALRVSIPDNRTPERVYILDVVLQEFLGLDYSIETTRRTDFEITLNGDHSGRTLRLPDDFLGMQADAWLTESSLPARPLPTCIKQDFPFEFVTTDNAMPVIYGTKLKNAWAQWPANTIELYIDVFGSCFFMLTRYEEAVTLERDRHDRFSAFSSLAYQENFLHRPIVNEYVALLWGAMSYLWPGLQRKQREYRPLLSHDVDWPIVTHGLGWKRVIKSAAGDILSRRDPGLAARRLAARFPVERGDVSKDPGNVFRFMMEESEKRGIQSSFYFIADHSGAGTIDGTYSLSQSWVINLMHEIGSRGHEIGLHPSFETYLDAGQTKREFDRLKAASSRAGVHQTRWGGRQHYLRWRNPDTWRNWHDAGLQYDSTLGFADHVGFRCGVCYEYPVFDLLSRETLGVRERPLIVMEGTLFKTTSPAYMALSDELATASLEALNAKVKTFDGDFTLLWHNSALISRNQKSIYTKCLGLL